MSVILCPPRLVKPPAWAINPAFVHPRWSWYWRLLDHARRTGGYAEHAPNLGEYGPRGLLHGEALNTSGTVVNGLGEFGHYRLYDGTVTSRDALTVTDGPAQAAGGTVFWVVGRCLIDFTTAFGSIGAPIANTDPVSGNGYMIALGELYSANNLQVWEDLTTTPAVIADVPFGQDEPFCLVFVRRDTTDGILVACNLRTGEYEVQTTIGAGVPTGTVGVISFGDYADTGDTAFDGEVYGGGHVQLNFADASYDASLMPTDRQAIAWAQDPFGPFSPDVGLLMERGLLAPWVTPVTGGTTFERSYAGTVSFVGDVARQAEKPIAGDVDLDGDLERQTQKDLAGGVSFAGAVATIVTVLRNFAGGVTFTGELERQTQKPIAGASSFAGELTRETQKALDGGVSFAGAVAVIRTVLITLAGSVSFVGDLVRQAQLQIDGAVDPEGDVEKQTQRQLDGGVSFNGALGVLRTVLVALAGAVSFAGDVTRQAQLVLAGDVTIDGAVTKLVGKVLAGATSFVGAVTKIPGLAFDAAIGFVGAVATAVLTNVFVNYVDGDATLIEELAADHTLIEEIGGDGSI